LVVLIGYGAGWLPLALPLVLITANLLLVFKAHLNGDMAFIAPPGMLPLLLLVGLPLVQLIPLPPFVLKSVLPGTWRFYGETIWLVAPGAWMPASLYPKATLDAFFFLALAVVVYLLTANFLRERQRLEKALATLTTISALSVILSFVLQLYPSTPAIGLALSDIPVEAAGYSGLPHLQILLIALFPGMLLFACYRLSQLRLYSVREKIVEIFNRKSLGFTGLATTLVSLCLICIYISIRSASVFSLISAGGLIFCGLFLMLKPRRRALSLPAFLAGFFFCLAAVFAGYPSGQKKQFAPESRVGSELELRLLSLGDVAPQLLRTSPVLGTGLGTGQRVRFRLAEVGGVTAALKEVAAPTDLTVGAGLVGVLLAGWFLVSLILRTVGRWQESKGRLADCLLVASLAGLFILFVSFLLVGLPVAVFLWAFFLAGLAVAVSSPQGAKGETTNAAASISTLASKAEVFFAILIIGAWALFALGAMAGKWWFPEAWQLDEGWEERDSNPDVAASRAHVAGVLDPLESRYPYAQAELWLAAGNFPAARKQLVAALQREPLSGKYLQVLGELEARNGDAALGEQLILAGCEDRSAIPGRQLFYAQWLAASARTEEAMQVVREVLTQAPGQTRSFLQMMSLEGIPIGELRQALPNRAQCFIAYADFQRESGDLKGAQESYQTALELATGEMDAGSAVFQQLCHYFSSEGDDESALTALQAGLRLLPTDADLRRLSGDVYKRLGIRFRAAEEYRMALLSDPENREAMQGLAEVTAE